MSRLWTVLGLVASIATHSDALANGLDTLVKIDSGYVSGSGAEIRAYKGIPYAAPPVGALRWTAPQLVKPWNGIRVSKAFSPGCAQQVLLPQPNADQRVSEDCLTLNVWSSADQSDEKLPVLVWIHGGGFFAGSSSSTAYEGEGFAKQGIVFVSFNYRLGTFGFLAHPELSKESPRGTSGNYALQDMVAALNWIKRNIAAFGGDPNNVTIWGESAGGTAVGLLMVAPDAKDLFHKAILSSAWNLFQPISHRTESWYGRVPAESVGAKRGDIATLRAKSTDEILKSVGMIDFNMEGEHTGDVHYHIVDGVIVPDDPALLFEQGKFHKVAVLAGTVSDEGTMFARSVRAIAPAKTWIERATLPSAVDKLQQQYGLTSDAAANASFAAIFGDANFVMGTRAVLRAVSAVQPQTYQYEFTRVGGFGRRTRLGAFHAADLGYAFNTLPDSPYGTTGILTVLPTDFDATDSKVAAAYHGAIARFVKTGDPNGGDLPTWPAFKKGDERYMQIGDANAVKADLHKERLDVLEAVYKEKRKKAKK